MTESPARFRIRQFADGDRAFAADLVAAEWPHRADEAIPLRTGDHLPNAPRWTAESAAGEPVAYASLWRVVGDRFRMDLAVAPEWRRQGIGSALLETIAAAAGAGAARRRCRRGPTTPRPKRCGSWRAAASWRRCGCTASGWSRPRSTTRA